MCSSCSLAQIYTESMEFDCPFVKGGKVKVRFRVLGTEGDIPAQAKLHGIILPSYESTNI